MMALFKTLARIGAWWWRRYMDCHFSGERFKFSWKICNALLMMMMQRLNHRLRHVKLMNDSLCRILGKGEGVALTVSGPLVASLVQQSFHGRSWRLSGRRAAEPRYLRRAPSSVASWSSCCGVNLCLVLVVFSSTRWDVCTCAPPFAKGPEQRTDTSWRRKSYRFERVWEGEGWRRGASWPAVVVGLFPIVTAPWCWTVLRWRELLKTWKILISKQINGAKFTTKEYDRVDIRKAHLQPWCCPAFGAAACAPPPAQRSIVEIFFQFSISCSSRYFLTYFFLFALSIAHVTLQANEYARLSCASSPCLCPCSSSRTWDSGSDCCSSGWHLQHQPTISRWENEHFFPADTNTSEDVWLMDKERRRWCFQQPHMGNLTNG